MNLGFKKQLLLLVLFLGVALFVVFNYPAFMPTGNNAALPFINPSQMLFNNDGPLGYYNAEQNRVPQSIGGRFGNLYWMGGEGVGESPRISTTMLMILGPELYVKYYPFLALVFLGFCVFLFLRQLKFNTGVCILGGVAAGLNMHFFSVGAWGLSIWNIGFACFFLGAAALVTDSIRQWWARAILAGLAVGVMVMEGYDTGAILSMYFGVFALFAGLISNEPVVTKYLKTGIGLALIVMFALFISYYSIDNLVNTQIKGVAGVEKAVSTPKTPEEQKQAEAAKEQRWGFSTQWSLPKLETLKLLIPGVVGYHMYENVDGPDKSSAYWGRIAEDPNLTLLKQYADSPDPQIRAQAEAQIRTFGGYRRHSGSGDYAGVLVMLLCAFAVANSFRGARTPYSTKEKRFVWFWFVVTVLSLVLAWGRFGSLYRVVFNLPYFSATRNPIKFMHPLFVATAILAAYGAEAIWRLYMQNGLARNEGLVSYVLKWWGRVTGFEKKWTIACLIAIAVSLFGLFVLASKKDALEAYMTNNAVVAGTEPHLAAFCIYEVTCYVIFLTLSVIAMTFAISGAWRGKQAKWAWILMGLILMFDLGRADRYWLKYYNYREKYALNPILDFLHKEPYDKKSTAKLTPFGPYDISGCPAPRTPLDNNFYAVCNEWLQNQFPYYNIQSVDIVQSPRTPEMDMNYAHAFSPRTSAELPLSARLWQLSNTRYIFCWAGYLTNSIYQGSPPLLGLDRSPDAFEVKTRLKVVPGPGVVIPTTQADLDMEMSNDGDFVLVEYKNALPRAKLYSNWQISESDDATLNTLRSPSFDPHKSVIISKETQVPAPVSPNADAGTVKIEDYHPKYIKFQANVNAPSVLLFNERFTDHWEVLVDNKPEQLLRCNYLMRGVHLDKGQHTVQFKYHAPKGPISVTLAGWAFAIVMAGFVVMTNRGRDNGVNEPVSKPTEKAQK